ncbi:NmrA/HSCARG family protein [Streptomyces sp. NBC_01304]|uniref:NmrA/HSCARG family protein n=1 Tax=Streptomyces sp. NBC_01304 TaxID=2903818 RepID=UPI002E1222E8|nr:NmrA/HSCARG family protein [Streptomyces sp. NBC_01304]
MDTNGKIILVTGATGNQGGATARHLLADGWRVRALVRDEATPAAVELAAAGVELVRGDLNDRTSVDAAMRGAYGAYSVQSDNPDEISQAKNIADAAQSAELRHLVYSSVGGMEEQNRFYVEHGWGPIDKWQIEQHLNTLDIPVTILRPAGFMEDFTSPARFFQDGALNVPWHDDMAMKLIAIDDVGAFAALAFADPGTYAGRTMEIAGDRLTAPQIADALGRAAGRPVPHTRIPLEVLWEHAPEVAKVMAWANGTFYDIDLAPVRRAFPGVMDFGTWLDRSGKQRLLAQLAARKG